MLLLSTTAWIPIIQLDTYYSAKQTIDLVWFVYIKQTTHPLVDPIKDLTFCYSIRLGIYLLSSRVGVRGFYIIDGLCAGMGIFVYLLMMMLVVY